MSVTSPPRGALLRALDVSTPLLGTEPQFHACRNYIWTFVVLLAVWGALMITKPTFLLNSDKTLSYPRLFWTTLAISVVIVLGICYYQQGGF